MQNIVAEFWAKKDDTGKGLTEILVQQVFEKLLLTNEIDNTALKDFCILR